MSWVTCCWTGAFRHPSGHSRAGPSMPLVPACPTDQRLGDVSIWLAGPQSHPSSRWQSPLLQAVWVQESTPHIRRPEGPDGRAQLPTLGGGLPLPGPGSEGRETDVHSKLGRRGEKRRRGATHPPPGPLPPHCRPADLKLPESRKGRHFRLDESLDFDRCTALDSVIKLEV